MMISFKMQGDGQIEGANVMYDVCHYLTLHNIYYTYNLFPVILAELYP